MAKILIVDDDSATLSIFSDVLSEYDIECASDGKEAIKVAKSFYPDIVLLDYNMPEMNGISVMEQLKRDLALSAFVMITAEDRTDLAVAAIRAGALDYIVKNPFDKSYLKLVVKKSLVHVNLLRERHRANQVAEEGQINLASEKQKLEELVFQRTHALNSALNEAKHANEEKTEVLSNMSHELRTPLHGILSFSRLGINHVNSDDPEKVISYFNKISDCGNRLLYLLNQLLDVSALESGKIEFSFVNSKVNDVIQPVIQEFEGLSLEKNIRIAYNNSFSNLSIEVDQERMMQVIRNLIGNAFKFSPKGSALEISVEDQNDHVCLSIKDRGKGIPPTDLTKIFSKFSQGKNTKSGAGGIGLGLFIAKQIVEYHRGKIWAENAKDCGAIFQVLLPKKIN